VNSAPHGKLVGDAINNCLTKPECELNALIALQQFNPRSVCMLLFACCNGKLIFKAFVSNISPPGTYSRKQRGQTLLKVNKQINRNWFLTSDRFW